MPDSKTCSPKNALFRNNQSLSREIRVQTHSRRNNEKTAESDSFVLNEHAVVARDLHGRVREKREGEIWAHAALVAVLARPREVRVLGLCQRQERSFKSI